MFVLHSFLAFNRVTQFAALPKHDDDFLDAHKHFCRDRCQINSISNVQRSCVVGGEIDRRTWEHDTEILRATIDVSVTRFVFCFFSSSRNNPQKRQPLPPSTEEDDRTFLLRSPMIRLRRKRALKHTRAYKRERRESVQLKIDIGLTVFRRRTTRKNRRSTIKIIRKTLIYGVREKTYAFL